MHASMIAEAVAFHYGVMVDEVVELHGGADFDASTFRLVSRQSLIYFLKLRRTAPALDVTGTVQWLIDSGLPHLIKLIPTIFNLPCARFGTAHAVLQPYVEGQSGWDVALNSEQWRELGRTLKMLHTMQAPTGILDNIPRETFSPAARESVTIALNSLNLAEKSEAGPSVRELRRLLMEHREVIECILLQAAELASSLAHQNLPFSLCHSDLHAGNLLIESSGHFNIIDWDGLIFAPPERDLMFIGGGVGGIWNREEEQNLFMKGYRSNEVNLEVLSYYRLERIIQDIAEFIQYIETPQNDEVDRAMAVQQFATQFTPGNVVPIALATSQNYWNENYGSE